MAIGQHIKAIEAEHQALYLFGLATKTLLELMRDSGSLPASLKAAVDKTLEKVPESLQ